LGHKLRIPITINHTKVAENIANFQLYIDLSLLGDEFWKYVKDGGGDIRIFSGDSECPREIVSCDVSTKTGEVHALIPWAISSIDIVIHIQYGDPFLEDYSPTDIYGSNAVWADTPLVYHLDEKSGTSIKNSGHKAVGGIIEVLGLLYYPLNGDASDKSLAGYNGTLVNSPQSVEGRLGDINGAYRFNGQVNGPRITSLRTVTTIKTISIWYKTSDISASDMCILGESNWNNSFYWKKNGSGDFDLRIPISGVNHLFAGINPLADGEWHQDLFAYSLTNSKLYWYRDGYLVMTKTSSGSNTNTPGTLVIGGNATYPTFNGDIDEFYIGNGYAYAGNIRRMHEYNYLYDLNTVYRNGKVGNGSMEFWGLGTTGQNNRISGGNNSVLIKNQEPFAIVLWNNPTVYGNPALSFNYNRIGWYGGNYKGPYIGISGYNISIAAGQGTTTGSNSNYNYTVNNALTPGLWHRIVYLYDGDWLKLYVNGIKIHEYQIGILIDNGAGHQNFRVNSSPWDTTAGGNAYYDEVRVYNRALSEAEIIADLNNESSPSTFYSIGQPEHV
jgi:hypothetical protein